MHLAPPCRSQKDESLPLKRGMLRYAHTRQLPVQVRWSVAVRAAAEGRPYCHLKLIPAQVFTQHKFALQQQKQQLYC